MTSPTPGRADSSLDRPRASAEADPTTAPAGGMTHRGVLASLSGLLLGMFVSMLASTVVSTSMPTIIHDLGGNQAAYTWVITATMLATAVSTPVWGKLADLTNRKLLFQIALVVFVLASAGAGFSQDTNMLIAARTVQGLGAGGLAALSQVLMADILSPRERGKYAGLFGAVMAVATVGGPLLGGVITDTFGWEWNFFVAVPVAVVALITVQRTLRVPTQPRKKVSIDYFGMVLLAVSVSSLLIWVTMAGSEFDWWSIPTLVLVGIGVVTAVAFVIVELNVREPLIPLTLFRNRTFTLSVIASIGTGIAMFGSSVYLAQYMQLARGATPTEAGLMTIPMIVGLLISSIVVGQLLTRFGHWKPYLVVGSLLVIIGTATLSTLHYDTNFVLVSVYMFVLGAGVGMTMQNLVLIVQNVIAPQHIGAATSGVTFFRTIGGTVGVSVMGAVLAANVTSQLETRSGDIASALASLGDKAAEWAAQLSSGALPQVALMPDALRTIFEDVYAGGISSAFLVGIPFAIVALIAVCFLPNTSLTRLTTSQRQASEESPAHTAAISTIESTAGITGEDVHVADGAADIEAEAQSAAKAGAEITTDPEPDVAPEAAPEAAAANANAPSRRVGGK